MNSHASSNHLISITHKEDTDLPRMVSHFGRKLWQENWSSAHSTRRLCHYMSVNRRQIKRFTANIEPLLTGRESDSEATERPDRNLHYPASVDKHSTTEVVQSASKLPRFGLFLDRWSREAADRSAVMDLKIVQNSPFSEIMYNSLPSIHPLAVVPTWGWEPPSSFLFLICLYFALNEKNRFDNDSKLSLRRYRRDADLQTHRMISQDVLSDALLKHCNHLTRTVPVQQC